MTSNSAFLRAVQVSEGASERWAENSRRRALGFGRGALLIGLGTASFDLFLVLDVHGFTLRIHQVLLALSLASMLQLTYRDQPLRIPIGLGWLVLWTAFILAFIPNTVYVPRSVGYGLWLLLDVMIIVVTVQLFGDRRWIHILLVGYLRSFLIVGTVGMLQFLLGVMHLPAPFVQQWWIPGAWPRINGFSYEPSYFSTYMLMGWIFSGWLLEKRSFVLGKRLIQRTFLVSTLSIIFATSRIGWIMLVLWGLFYCVRRIRDRHAVKISPITFVVALVGFATATAGVALSSSRIHTAIATMLAGGTGLYGTPAHSVANREQNFALTLEIFEKSPVVGYSLGGVASAIGALQGSRITGNNDAKHNEGGSVAVELLAASGIIGIIPLVVYFMTLVRRPLLKAKPLDADTAAILCGLVWALCMELLILQFNQNVLRAYLWFHIAVLSAAYFAITQDGWRAATLKEGADVVS